MSVAGVDKIMGLALSVGALAPGFFTNDLTTPVIGVQVTTIAGAVLGTYAAIGYDESAKPRGRLFALAIATVIISSMAVGVIPKAMGWTWSSGGVEGGLAGLSAVLCYYLLPKIIKRAGEIIASFNLTDFLPARKARAAVTPPQDNAGPSAPEDPNK